MDDREVILALLERAGLSRLSAKVELLMKPAVFAKPIRADHVDRGASRFGGNPDLPPGIDWPTAWDVPMQFVAQVRLRDIAPHDADGVLPRTGSLLFFHNEQSETSDMCHEGAPLLSSWKHAQDPQYAPNMFACGRVLFWPGTDDALVPTQPPRLDYEDNYGRRVAPETFPLAALSFEPMLSLPAEVSAFLSDSELADVRETWGDFLRNHAPALPPFNRLGVVVDNTRAARYQSHHLLGYPDGDDNIEAMSADDVLLLQIDSDSEAAFQWGEFAQLHFIASRLDIARGDFSRVRLHRDL